MINFRKITEDNFDAIIKMKRPDGENFVASNAHSLAQAWLYRDDGDVFPFAIYNDDIFYLMTPMMAYMKSDGFITRLTGEKDMPLTLVRPLLIMLSRV